MMDPAGVRFGHLDQPSPNHELLPCSCAMPNCRGIGCNCANDAIHHMARRCVKTKRFRTGELPGAAERSTSSFAKLLRHDCPAHTLKERRSTSSAKLSRHDCPA